MKVVHSLEHHTKFESSSSSLCQQYGLLLYAMFFSSCLHAYVVFISISCFLDYGNLVVICAKHS